MYYYFTNKTHKNENLNMKLTKQRLLRKRKMVNGLDLDLVS